MRFKVCIFSTLIFFYSCNDQPTRKIPVSDKKTVDTALDNYVKLSREKEQAFTEKQTDSIGELINSISFPVKTKDKKDYEDGLIPWASIESPEKDLPNLVQKNSIVIQDTAVTIVIDYPLTNKYQFNIFSETGFTRTILLKEISKHYYTIYKEEEATATVKTLPMAKRKMMNRNETNGKYGIWGHDIADLVLDEILVYKTLDGKIILMLNIES